MMTDLTLKRFTILMSAVLFVIGSVVVIGGLYASDRLALVRAAWNSFLLSSSEQAILESRLKLSLGYGGMIHSFKNYVIRQDPILLHEARSHLDNARQHVFTYRSLELSQEERKALMVIENTLEDYEQAMAVTRKMVKSETSLYVIDVMARVNDEGALQALDTLHQANLQTLNLSSDEKNKSFLLAKLRSKLGYGGMIHAFKNYLIRATGTYAQTTLTSGEEALSVIQDYRQLNITLAESFALDEIEATIMNYLKNVPIIREGLAINTPIAVLDQQIKIDDTPAFRAFQTLENQILAQSAQKSRTVDQVLHEVENLSTLMVSLIAVSFLLVMAFLVWLFQYVISKPIRDITLALSELSLGNYDTDLPDKSLITEISDMNQSAMIFKEKAIDQRAQDQEIVEAHKLITESVRYSSRIQQSLLPMEALFQEHFRDYFIIWEPRDVVGGDLYWFRADRRGVMMAVFDCTGHGVPGALMTTIAISALNRGYATTTDPGRLIRFVNQQIKNALGQDCDQGLSDDGLEIGVCLIERERNRLSFAGARFELFELVNGTIETHKGNKSGVGYRRTAYDQKFDTHEIKLLANSCFYLCTDGLVDQIGGEKNRMFGKKRFRDALISIEELPLPFQKEALLKIFETFQGCQTRRDDLTVIGFKP